MKIKAFWNDSEGLTLNEFVAVSVISFWVIVSIIMLYLLRFEELTDRATEVYSIFSNIPLTVVIGLFGQGAVSEISNAVGIRSSILSLGSIGIKKTNNATSANTEEEIGHIDGDVV